MSHPEPTHTRSAIIADLACLVGEVAQIQADQAQLAERQSALQGRLGKMIRDLSTTTAIARPQPAPVATKPAERPAPAAQAAPPPGRPPSAQDTARPVRAGKALDEASVEEVGGLHPDQSRECRHVAGAGGESAASADTAPAADEKEPAEPRVPRRPAQVVPGNGRVQDGGEISRGDQVLDLWATTLLSYDEIAAKLKVNPNTPSAYVSAARTKGDPRAKQGDEPREKIRYDKAMDLYASTDLPAFQIDRKVGLPAGMMSKYITKAWGDGDQRVKDGDVRRRPPPPKAEAPKPHLPKVEAAAEALPPIPDGALILIDRPNKRIVGPSGAWGCLPWEAKTLEVIADGQLYGLDRMAAATGLKQDALTHSLPHWTRRLREIGIDLVHTPHIGCKLNRIAA